MTKLNVFQSAWNAINTCLIVLLAIWINISLYIPTQLELKVDKMQIELEAYKNMNQDSIIIHVDNHINVPKSIRIVK